MPNEAAPLFVLGFANFAYVYVCHTQCARRLPSKAARTLEGALSVSVGAFATATARVSGECKQFLHVAMTRAGSLALLFLLFQCVTS